MEWNKFNSYDKESYVCKYNITSGFAVSPLQGTGWEGLLPPSYQVQLRSNLWGLRPIFSEKKKSRNL